MNRNKGLLMRTWALISFLSLLFISVSIQAATVRYQHTDMLGSVVSESDASGNIISRSQYEPFGKRMGGDKEGIGYTGHLQDKDLGLTYMQARYYDPLIGRFYSNDPVGFTNVHTFNRYAYANNNPYKYVDPDGRTGVPFALTPMDRGVGPTGQQDLTLEQQAIGAVMVVSAATMLVPDPTDVVLAGAASKVSTIGRGQQVGRMIKSDGSTKASEIKAKAESVGFKPTQSGNGPLKMVDENGTARVTIKGGSDRAPGSQGPHVELKDSSGQRVNPAGEPVTRKSPENHTPIRDDR